MLFCGRFRKIRKNEFNWISVQQKKNKDQREITQQQQQQQQPQGEREIKLKVIIRWGNLQKKY